MLIYIVTLKCSSNLSNCDFTVMFYQNEISFVAKTTDLTLLNLKPLLTNLNSIIFFLILECPDPCECDVFHQTFVSVNCSGKSVDSIPWQFPLAMSKL